MHYCTVVPPRRLTWDSNYTLILTDIQMAIDCQTIQFTTWLTADKDISVQCNINFIKKNLHWFVIYQSRINYWPRKTSYWFAIERGIAITYLAKSNEGLRRLFKVRSTWKMIGVTRITSFFVLLMVTLRTDKVLYLFITVTLCTLLFVVEYMFHSL